LIMSFGKTTAIVAGFAGAFGLGIWTGPMMMHRDAPEAAAVVAPAPAAEARSAIPASRPPARRARATATSGIVKAERTTDFVPMKTSVEISAPQLQQRLKPLFKPGAKMEIAADGFYSAEQFATMAHASQNTDVPFMLLKHRVLTEGDTLVAAIRKSKPDLNAVVEVDRARAEARSDLAQLQ
jgi:hypothetical protein